MDIGEKVRHVRNQLLEQNVIRVLRDGPRITTKYNVWVEARDREKKLVLIGGLGGMGVGQMWFPEEGHEDYRFYEDAPEQKSG